MVATQSMSGLIGLAVYVFIVLAIYFVPTVIAAARNHANKKAIILFNIFLGWTFVMWIVTFVWSLRRSQ